MIRVAAIGTSTITRRTIAAAGGVPNLAFTTVFSRDAERAAQLASEVGLAGSTNDFAGLLASPDVDAVYVATPNLVHAEQVRAALDAGKHVFVEKPAVSTASEWDALCALASERGVVLLENMRTAYDPVMVRLLELLPSLGTIRRASFRISQRSSRYDDVLAGRPVNIFDPALGGGALADLGIYLTHPVGRLFGTPDAVAASAVILPTGADGAGAALLDYPGLVADVAWSKITGGVTGVWIEGELGTLHVDHPTELEELDVAYLNGDALRERPDKAPDNITYSLQRFANLIETGGSASEDQSWTRISLDLLQLIREASAR